MENFEEFAEALKNKNDRELNPNELLKLTAAVAKLHWGCDQYKSVASLFRCLRNACADCPANQTAILQCTALFDGTLNVFQAILKQLEGDPFEDALIAARCSLQFFGNFAVQNEDSQKMLWERLFAKSDLLCNLLNHLDEKLSSYASFCLFNCLTMRPKWNDNFPEMVSALTKQLERYDSVWSLCCLESLIQSEDFMSQIYPSIPIDSRLVILDVIVEQLGKSPLQPNSCCISDISHLFRERAPNVVAPISDMEVEETIKLLTLLCVASTSEEYIPVLKSDSKLLQTCLDVLRGVHVLGKSGQSQIFSPVQSLSQDPPQPHPTEGFKAQLVRLLGNLVHQSPSNQDAVRLADGIPLLLECSNIDIKNPFITQWCILAIRNLMDGNTKNQEVLAAVTLCEPSLADSPLLRELGLEMTTDGKLIGKQRKS